MISQEELKQKNDYEKQYYCPNCGRKAVEYQSDLLQLRYFTKYRCYNCKFVFYLRD